LRLRIKVAAAALIPMAIGMSKGLSIGVLLFKFSNNGYVEFEVLKKWWPIGYCVHLMILQAAVAQG
jgi:hypothetical protein